MSEKIIFKGIIKAIQPRIRLMRSFDEKAHTYLGYFLVVNGMIEDSEDENFTIALGKGAQAKFLFRAGDEIEGKAIRVENPKIEAADYFKISGLKLLNRTRDDDSVSDAPPFLGVPPTLPEYRDIGCRRLYIKAYEENCWLCLWSCKMPVEIIKDHWKPHLKSYRMETFCYGPRDCKLYKSGRKRQVPGRGLGMVYVDEDEQIWI